MDIRTTKDLDNSKLILEYTTTGTKEAAWSAYSDKEQFEAWWGPEGWDTTTQIFDFSPGGKIHYGMKCVDEAQGEWFGQTSWGLMVISDVQDGESFTYKDYFSDESGEINTELPALTITNQFIQEDGETRIISTSQADSAEQIEQLLAMGMLDGFSSQLRKLDSLLS